MISHAVGSDALLIARHHLLGFHDEAGRALTAAQVMAFHRDLLGPQLLGLTQQMQPYLANPDDPRHAQAHHLLQQAVHARGLRGRWRLARYDAPIEYYLAKRLGVTEEDVQAAGGFGSAAFSAADRAGADAAMKRDQAPHVDEWEEVPATFDNLFLTAGITALWNMAIGSGVVTSGNPATANANAYFSNLSAMIGVGDSSAAASAGQTDLQASTNKAYVGMDATYPAIATNAATYRATFGASTGNFSWQEFVMNNRNATQSSTTGGSTLDRAVSNQGTKVSGQTWQPSLTTSIS